MTTTLPYVYRVVEVVKVTDGDTYWLRLDVGFRQQILIDCRLSGWDAPEMYRGSDYEKRQARVAQKVASDWLATALDVGLWIRTEKDPDSFGRWLGVLWVDESDEAGTDLGMVLATQGLASPWPTRWHDQYDTTEAQNGA